MFIKLIMSKNYGKTFLYLYFYFSSGLSLYRKKTQEQCSKIKIIFCMQIKTNSFCILNMKYKIKFFVSIFFKIFFMLWISLKKKENKKRQTTVNKLNKIEKFDNFVFLSKLILYKNYVKFILFYFHIAIEKNLSNFDLFS